MKFVIRDDDLNYFSTPADIERWYADIFAQQIPVGFAAIPFVTKASDVYPNLPLPAQPVHHGEEFPIGDNTALVEYIKGNPLIEIVQHGSTHETVDGVFEYAQPVDLREATQQGKAELERAFGKPVKVFAPPHDWINTPGIRAVEAAHMDIIRGRGAGLRNLLWRWQYAVVFVRMLLYRFPRYISTAPPVYPHVLNFGKHKEACSYRLEDADVFDGLAYTHKKNGVFVVVTHLHFYNDEKKQRLLKLIAQAKALGAEFVLPNSIF
jgi:peptidoglycan/xylan/chitin deacetylase (PgdA/CDA1 family)